MAVDAANEAVRVLRMLACWLKTTAAEAAGPTNAEHNSQMQSSPTTASWPRLSPSFRAWFLTASKPSPAPSSVGSYLSQKSRSDRGTPNPSPSPSSWVSYLSNLRWLKNVQLGRDVANGSLQLDDERPMTRRELRAAKRRAEFWAMMREEQERDWRVSSSSGRWRNGEVTTNAYLAAEVMY